MSLADDYRRQYAWRDWKRVFDALPVLTGQRVLDLGCAIGDQAAELAARGARVVAIDANEELLTIARARGDSRIEFRTGDLREELALGGGFDGLWCSFGAAYFCALAPRLAAWTSELRPGAWVVLTEIDDLFGHAPLAPRTRAWLGQYAREALAAGRYDFEMGRKLATHARAAGLEVVRELELADAEFSSAGPARTDVIDAWRQRFERMTLLRDLCGAEFDAVRDDFLACLASPDHRSSSRVVCLLARVPDRTPRVERVSVREGYDLWAEDYDATPNPLVALDERHTLAQLAPRAGERILDAGCGTGRNLVRLVAAGARASGVDLSSGMLAVARRRCPETELAVADLHTGLAFEDARFDAVLCALIGEHLRDLDRPLAEFARVLAPGGRLVFSVYHPDLAAAGKEANFARAGVEYRLGAERHTLAEYESALMRAGFVRRERSEYALDAELARTLPNAARYIGVPQLVVWRAWRG